MYIVARRHLNEASQRYPDAANEVRAWAKVIEAVRWRNFSEVRSIFTDADYVNGYVVFNFRKNRYRLVTIIHFPRTRDKRQTAGHVYVRSFLTHKEYDNPKNWDRRFGAK